jgi:hypothetical protein
MCEITTTAEISTMGDLTMWFWVIIVSGIGLVIIYYTGTVLGWVLTLTAAIAIKVLDCLVFWLDWRPK